MFLSTGSKEPVAKDRVVSLKNLSFISETLKKNPALLLPLLAIVALWPLLKNGLPVSSDGALHLLRLVVLDHNIIQGNLYPRWVPELYVGLGYPLFNFYAPMGYYVAELFYWLGFDIVFALIIAFCAFVVMGGYGMFFLAKAVFGPKRQLAALVAAAAYMFAPYLLTNVYIRGAIAEVAAQAFLPWVFWSIRGLFTHNKPARYFLPLVLSLGALAISHNITLLFAPFVIASYAFAVWWQNKHRLAHLKWFVAGSVLAMGVSAFFWMPLIFERNLLTQTAYEIAAKYLPENMWRWDNFLDLHLFFEYTFDVPFQLGLIQTILALAGFFMAGKRSIEWGYYALMVIVLSIFVSTLTLSLWLGSNILLIAQFSWRLLSFITIALALLTGAVLIPFYKKGWQMISAVILIALIVLANYPRVGLMQQLAAKDSSVPLPAVSHFEYDTGAFGAGSSHEFLPRWNKGLDLQPATDTPPIERSHLVLHQTSPTQMNLSLSSEQSGPLHFTNLYYPGWKATLEDDTSLKVYPSTNLGLLTVDVPSGDHTIDIRWVGTNAQNIALAITLISLLIVLLVVWRSEKQGIIVAIPVLLLVSGVFVFYGRSKPVLISPPSEVVATSDFQMLGYRSEVLNDNRLLIYPYWYAKKNPVDNVKVSWQLRSKADNSVLIEMTARHYFSTQQTRNWPANTVVDDVYQIPLSNQIAPNTYKLYVNVSKDHEVQNANWLAVGDILIKRTIPPQKEIVDAIPLHLVFGDQVELDSFALKRSGKSIDLASSPVTVIKPGEVLNYSLYWRALHSLDQNYHSFIHLVDYDGSAVISRDQITGSIFNPSILWNSSALQHDYFILRLPQDIPQGLYWPTVGLYEFDTVTLLEVKDAQGQAQGNTYRLPPVKVLGSEKITPPTYKTDVRFGNFATLIGYDLTSSTNDYRANSELTVTLYYKATSKTAQDLTQFIQIYNPQTGMAAQMDRPPLDGRNPTSTWIPNEIIVNKVTLKIKPDVTPGEYQVLVGLYDFATGARLPLAQASDPSSVTDNLLLTTIQIAP